MKKKSKKKNSKIFLGWKTGLWPLTLSYEATTHTLGDEYQILKGCKGVYGCV